MLAFNCRFFNNAYYARVGGVSTQEMNKLEMNLLFSLDFRLQVNIPTFERYCLQLVMEASKYRVERPVQFCLRKEWPKIEESKCQPALQRCSCGTVWQCSFPPLLSFTFDLERSLDIMLFSQLSAIPCIMTTYMDSQISYLRSGIAIDLHGWFALLLIKFKCVNNDRIVHLFLGIQRKAGYIYHTCGRSAACLKSWNVVGGGITSFA